MALFRCGGGGTIQVTQLSNGDDISTYDYIIAFTAVAMAKTGVIRSSSASVSPGCSASVSDSGSEGSGELHSWNTAVVDNTAHTYTTITISTSGSGSQIARAYGVKVA